MNTAVFNTLCQKAFAPNSTMDDKSRLWQAAFKLENWFFVKRGQLPNIGPYIAEANQIEPKSFWIYAFTNEDLCVNFAKANQLEDELLGTSFLSMPVNEDLVPYLIQFKNNGVKGIYFNTNTNAYGFYSPLEQLPIIKKYLGI